MQKKLHAFRRGRLFPVFLLLLVLITVHKKVVAQQITVTGRVSEKGSGLALPGVSVRVKGGTKATFTDAKGQFSLPLKPAERTLVFTFIGFNTRELAVKGTLLNVELSSSDTKLDEVVVVAYGTANRGSITGSVASINGEKLESRQVSDISKALQGMAPGIQTSSASGQPGTSAAVRIRGIGSINASSAPLYVVDGSPYDGDINAISPNDIASISVLKDASSSALYGSRGANGVIIITTKQGQTSGETKVNASVNQGFSSRAVKDYEQLTTDQYFELYWEALRNKGLTNGLNADLAANSASQNLVKVLGINPYGPDFPKPVEPNGKLDADARPLWNDSWADEMTRTGKRTEAELSFSGGNEKSRFYISGGYLNDQGVGIGSGFKRYNTRVNVSTQAKSWLAAGLNVSATNSKQDFPQSEDSQTSNIINFPRIVAGFYPVYERKEDGSLKLVNGKKVVDYGEYRPSAASPRTNLVGTVGLDKSEIVKDNVSARSFLEATILPELKFKTSYSADFNNRNDHFYSNPLYGGAVSIGGAVSRENIRTFSYTLSNILTYNKKLRQDHNLSLLAGQEFYSFNIRNMAGSRQKFVLPGFYEPVAASQLNDFTGQATDYALLSFLGRAEYDYLSKYYLSASVRTDGSSRFSPSSRWGTFWSVGASWKVSQEEFLKNQAWLDMLTLRASYGAQGNDNIGTYYAYESLYSIKNNLGESGVVTSRLPTPDLKWESNLNLNIGLDLAVFNNRLGASIEFFNRQSKDLLFSRPLAPSLGFSSIDANVGALRNKGIEVQLKGSPVVRGDFRWDIDFNITHYKNKITSLPQSSITSGTKKLMVGGSIYDFYIREWAGIDPETGNPQWYKVDENKNKTKTGKYSDATPTFQGSALPDAYGGITNTFRYKGIELSALLAYSLGGKILDSDYTMMLHNGSSPGRAWAAEIARRWTPENRNTNVPRLTTDNLSWTSTSTRFLYDASYARLKNLGLSYTLPKGLTQRLKVNTVRASLVGENLLTFYGHKGMDPEQAIGGTTYYRYPAMRTLSAGLQFNF